MARDWPLTGRTEELARVSAALGRPDRAGVLLVGPPGVGKTRLAAECLALAEQAGFAIARAKGTRAAADIPFGALASLLPAAGAPTADRAELLRRAAGALQEAGGDQPLVLLVDDAHLLDDASATLLHQVATSGAAFLVATLRSGEPVPDPITALWKESAAERIDIGPFAPEALPTVLSAALGGPVDSALVEALRRASGGNALSLSELVKAAVEAGALVRDAGIWRLTGKLATSARLTELVEARLGALGPQDRRVLELVALAEPLGIGVLERVATFPQIERLERAELLRVETSGRRAIITLANPLDGEILRASLGALHLRSLRRSLAEAYEAVGARRKDDILRLAVLRLDGGGEIDVRRMQAAAVEARTLFDFPLALRLGQAAHDAGAGFSAGLFVAQLHGVMGENERSVQRLEALVPQASTDEERAQLAITRIDTLSFGVGRVEEAFAVAFEAEAAIADEGWRAEIVGKRAYLMMLAGMYDAAYEAVAPLLHLEGRPLIWAAFAAGQALATQGRVAEALEISGRGYATQTALPDGAYIWYPCIHVQAQCTALLVAGRVPEARALAAAEHTKGVDSGSVEVQAWFAWYRAQAALAAGDVDAGVRWAREAVALVRTQGPFLLRWCLTTLVRAVGMTGSAPDADAALAELDATDFAAGPVMAGEVLRARAWVAACHKELSSARALLAAGAEAAGSIGDRSHELDCWLDLVRLDDAATAAPRLAALRTAVEGDLVGAAADLATAWVASDATALLAAADRFEAMGMVLVAAEAATKAGADERAGALLERCPGARTPALASAPAGAASHITQREREVAALAATGLSNREIAERLGSSPRTVANQLQRVYDKLGISGRPALAQALEG